MQEILYTNCDLPQPAFESASVTGDLSHIVKEPGDVDEEARHMAWLAINDEYLQLTGDTASAGYASDLEQHAAVGSKITVVQLLCQVAHEFPTDAIITHLRDMYPMLDFPLDDAEQLADDLARVELMLERDCLDFEQIAKKLEQEESDQANQDHSRPTQETFDRIKFAINDHKKMVYDFTKLTTRQYAILVRSLKEVKQPEQQAA